MIIVFAKKLTGYHVSNLSYLSMYDRACDSLLIPVNMVIKLNKRDLPR